MGRRSDHSREELQNLIIEATLQLVKEQGANKVTVRQIAQAVGYTPGMLYSVFVNLQDIFLHVNEHGLKTLFDLCERSQQPEQDPETAITQMGLAYLSFAAEHTHQFDLMFARQDLAQQSSLPTIKSRIQLLFGLIEAQMRLLAPKATEDRITLGARALWSGVHGIAALRLSNQLYLDTPGADQEIVVSLIGNFLNSWKQ